MSRRASREMAVMNPLEDHLAKFHPRKRLQRVKAGRLGSVSREQLEKHIAAGTDKHEWSFAGQYGGGQEHRCLICDKIKRLKKSKRGIYYSPNPGTPDLNKVRKLKGFEEWMINHPDFLPGIAKYVEFHGEFPKEITMHDAPNIAGDEEARFVVGMGRAMDTTYKPTNQGSNKFGSAYIHEFADDKKNSTDEDLPYRACTPDGKTILTFGGNFAVKDWVRG